MEKLSKNEAELKNGYLLKKACIQPTRITYIVSYKDAILNVLWNISCEPFIVLICLFLSFDLYRKI